MGMKHRKPRHQFYTTWYAGDDDKSDNWFGYLSRNLHHVISEDVPFHDSSWTHQDDEAEIHDEVLDAFYKHPQLDASEISVIVVQRTVGLVGYVKSEKERLLAEEIVKSLWSAWRVQNDLQVKTSEKSDFQTIVIL